MILVSGSRICTGSLVNNTEMDFKPYFLTADHCIESLDATGDTDASYFHFIGTMKAMAVPTLPTICPTQLPAQFLKPTITILILRFLNLLNLL